ncbi:hypothetical protein ACFOEY_15030 [Paracandidimonas soli]
MPARGTGVPVREGNYGHKSDGQQRWQTLAPRGQRENTTTPLASPAS